MPRNFFLHETVDIIGQGQYEYMDLVAREPVHDMPGLFRLAGTFFVMGASGARWPQVINLYDGGERGWDALTDNLDRLNLKRRERFYTDWWDEAAEFRSGGSDRLCGAAPGCPTTAELRDRGQLGTIFVHQVLDVRVCEQLEFLSAINSVRRPLMEQRGIYLTHLLEVTNNPTEVVVVWATDLPRWVELRKDFDTSRGLDDSGVADPQLIAWQAVERRFVTGGRTELMTPRPGSVGGPTSWDAGPLE